MRARGEEEARADTAFLLCESAINAAANCGNARGSRCVAESILDSD